MIADGPAGDAVDASGPLGGAVRPLRCRRSARCDGALRQSAHRRKRLALDKFEKCTAAGGDIRNTVLDPVFLDCSEGIAAAGQRKRLAARARAGDRACALTKLIK